MPAFGLHASLLPTSSRRDSSPGLRRRRCPPVGTTPTLVMPLTRATGNGVALGVIRDARPDAAGSGRASRRCRRSRAARARRGRSFVRGVDEARVDVGAGRVDDLRAGRDLHARADGFDLVAANDDGAALDVRRGDRMDPGVGDGQDRAGRLTGAAPACRLRRRRRAGDAPRRRPIVGPSRGPPPFDASGSRAAVCGFGGRRAARAAVRPRRARSSPS